jgi:hypothetical protein
MNMDRWYVGSQNDGLCIIDTKPSPAGTDVVWEGRKEVQHIACVDLITMNYDEASRCAKLLAAAPEMLEMLKRFSENDHSCSSRIDCLQCAALDVIEKAEGKVKV